MRDYIHSSAPPDIQINGCPLPPLSQKVTQAIQRKEKEIAAIAAKMEDEQSLGGKMHKQVKELSVSELERY